MRNSSNTIRAAKKSVKIVVTDEADIPDNCEFTVTGVVLQDAVQIFSHGYSHISVTVQLANGKLFNLPLCYFNSSNREEYSYARRLASCLRGDKVTLRFEYPEGAALWPTFVDFENERLSNWASPDDLVPENGDQN